MRCYSGFYPTDSSPEGTLKINELLSLLISLDPGSVVADFASTAINLLKKDESGNYSVTVIDADHPHESLYKSYTDFLECFNQKAPDPATLWTLYVGLMNALGALKHIQLGSQFKEEAVLFEGVLKLYNRTHSSNITCSNEAPLLSGIQRMNVLHATAKPELRLALADSIKVGSDYALMGSVAAVHYGRDKVVDVNEAIRRMLPTEMPAFHARNPKEYEKKSEKKNEKKNELVPKNQALKGYAFASASKAFVEIFPGSAAIVAKLIKLEILDVADKDKKVKDSGNTGSGSNPGVWVLFEREEGEEKDHFAAIEYDSKDFKPLRNIFKGIEDEKSLVDDVTHAGLIKLAVMNLNRCKPLSMCNTARDEFTVAELAEVRKHSDHIDGCRTGLVQEKIQEQMAVQEASMESGSAPASDELAEIRNTAITSVATTEAKSPPTHARRPSVSVLRDQLFGAGSGAAPAGGMAPGSSVGGSQTPGFHVA